MPPIMETVLRDYLHLVASGKVREIYKLDESKLLFVATDRISGICPQLVSIEPSLIRIQLMM